MGLIGKTEQQYYNEGIFGNYQFVSLNDIINQFILVYTGEDKIISKVSRVDVAFHAQRALAELSFDTFKSFKSQEITVPAALTMSLPQDYVNYTSLSSIDSSGIKRVLYPTSKTSNPTNPYQDTDGDFRLKIKGTIQGGSDIYLDGVHKNIKNGMVVDGLKNLNTGAAMSGAGLRVWYMTNVSDTYTNVYLWDGTTVIDPINDLGFAADDEIEFYFENTDGSLVPQEESSRRIDDCTITLGEYKIATPAATDTDNIKIGMIVSGYGISSGTSVTGIVGTTIYIDNALTDTVSATNQVFFVAATSISDTWSSYKSITPSENNNDDYEDDTYWPLDGERYGLDPQHAQVNGSFYIDDATGKIHFSSNISGKTVVLDYISDSLGTDDEMQVHKFAEEAMYKCIMHAVMSTRINVPEYIVNRYKKERFAAIRQTKHRLSNIKLEELTQTLRGKSKQIKH